MCSTPDEKGVDGSKRKRTGGDIECVTCLFVGPQGVCEMCGSHNNGRTEPLAGLAQPAAAKKQCMPTGPWATDIAAPFRASLERANAAHAAVAAAAARAEAARVKYEAINAECRRCEQRVELLDREEEKIKRKLSARTKEKEVPPPPPQALYGKYEDGSETYRCKVCHGWWDGDGATFCSRCVATKSDSAKAARNKLDGSFAALMSVTETRRRTHVSVIMAKHDVSSASDALHDAYHDAAVQTGELVCRSCASFLCPGDERDGNDLRFFRCKEGCCKSPAPASASV